MENAAPNVVQQTSPILFVTMPSHLRVPVEQALVPLLALLQTKSSKINILQDVYFNSIIDCNKKLQKNHDSLNLFIPGPRN